MIRVRSGAALLAAALVVAACASSASTVAPGSSAGSTPRSTAAATPKATPTSSSAATPSVVAPSFEMPAGGNGSCTVNITGAVTKSWTTKQDMGTLQVSQWLSESARSMLSIKPGDAWFIMNCKGGGGAVDFGTPDGTTEATFPVAPGDYAIPVGGALGGARTGQMSVLVNLNDKNLWHVSKAGTFSITKFGGSKIAGTFGFSMSSDAGNASVSGSFDLSCTGDACS